ncbi:MAG: hypothetical protein KUG64_06830 [Cycloclasticus sp.]|nr:hypothetical protein [Cycloclasticus sp.]
MSTDIIVWYLLGVVALLVIGGAYAVFILGGNKKKEDQLAIQKMAKRIKENASQRQTMFYEDEVFSLLEDSILKTLIEDIKETESKVYQGIFGIFLQKRNEVLQTIDQHVMGMGAPYRNALRGVVNDGVPGASNEEEVTALKADLEVEVGEKERLSEQLGVTIRTLDDVSNEYALLFDGNADQQELMASKERVISMFERLLREDARTEDINFA